MTASILALLPAVIKALARPFPDSQGQPLLRSQDLGVLGAAPSTVPANLAELRRGGLVARYKR